MMSPWVNVLLVLPILSITAAPSPQPAGMIGKPPSSRPDFAVPIENCGRRETAHVRSMLNRGLEYLPAAVDDMENPKMGYRRYDAFFKDDDMSVYASGILRRVYNGGKRSGLLPDPQTYTLPHIACATPNMGRRYPFTPSPWNSCLAGMLAMYAPNTRYVFLCPVFFSLPSGPVGPPKAICPVVDRNQYTTAGFQLISYQPLVLIHELIHFYLGAASLGAHTYPPEQYELNGCVSLNAMDSVHNPTNYQAYMSSTYSSFLAVRVEKDMCLTTMRNSGREWLYYSPRFYSSAFQQASRCQQQ